MTGPALPDVGILGLVPERWGGLWMGRHHILTGLARYFQVAWVNPAPGWREAWLGRPRRSPAASAPPPALPGFTVVAAGPLLPRFYRPSWLGRAVERARLAAARAHLVRRGVRRVIVSIWRPEFAPALDLVKHDLSCYHVADEYTFSPEDGPTPPDEAALLARAGQVVVHSEALLEKKGTVNPHTALLPNGVDYAAFATPTPEPRDVIGIPHPRIGYMGYVKEQLDLPLLTALARARPDWQFVFIGPVRERPDVRAALAPLAALSNVHLLGPRPTVGLAAYVQAFDVATMCYVEDGYTRYISPLKLHEYLAAGPPVVATPIRSLRSFGGIIRLARGADDWLLGIEQALAPAARAPAAVAARRAAAQEYDWPRIVARLAALLGERLGPGYVARLAQSSTPAGNRRPP